MVSPSLYLSDGCSGCRGLCVLLVKFCHNYINLYALGVESDRTPAGRHATIQTMWRACAVR